MISPAYVQLMARYNAWENRQLYEFLEPLTAEDWTCDRGAFFGSILGTLNHLLWGDRNWMARFYDPVSPPPGGMAESVALTDSPADWRAAREEMDTQITAWASEVTDETLAGDLTFYSGILRREVSRPLAPLVVHFFNHQPHHRGQVHTMLTAQGLEAPVSDIFLMPEDA